MSLSMLGALLKVRPVVPELEKQNLQEEQRKSISANLQNYGQITDLSRKAQSRLQEQGASDLDMILGSGVRKQIQENLSSGLRGEVPKDVQNLLARRSAERGVQAGTTGSSFNRNLELRDLGLTSLQRINQTMGAANQWLAAAQSRVGQFDFTNMFVSPTQQAAFSNQERMQQFQRKWVSNQLDATYSTRNIIGESLIKMEDQIMQLASAAAGSFGGMMA